MNDLPPKVVKAQLVRLDDSLKQIERTQVAGIQRAPGSLPVLEAFQAFLENERKNTRRRMMRFTVFSVFLLMAAAGGGVALIQHQMSKTAVDYDRISGRTEELAASIEKAEKNKQDELISLETKFSDESRRIIEQYAALLATQTTLAEQITGSETTIEQIRKQLEALSIENNMLKSKVATFSELPIAAADTVPPAEPSAIAVLPVESVETSAATTTTQPAKSQPDAVATINQITQVAAVTVTENSSVLLLTIIPEGQSNGVRWQLPRKLNRE